MELTAALVLSALFVFGLGELACFLWSYGNDAVEDAE